MLKKSSASVAAVAVAMGMSAALGSITIPTVRVGNPGNGPDPTTFNQYGSVAYTYNIGAYEVTNAQYTVFLNAVGAADIYNLYDTRMAMSYGGITRTGMRGTHEYQVVSGRENYPVVFVSFWSAMRFTNWLHNGQPSGQQNASTTEDGAYTLTSGGINTNTVPRNAGWQWAMPSDDEWYKAAYHQPEQQGGTSVNYWRYPTSSNTITTADANYASQNSVPVGSYAPNFYGAFDMAGNVAEWTEGISSPLYRRIRGGLYNAGTTALASGSWWSMSPHDRAEVTGFRVVQVPGPASWALIALGGAAALRRRRGAGPV